MFNAHGRGVIRLGDKTDHGGTVISASEVIAMGRPVATEDCLTHCPQCEGDFTILLNGETRTHQGKSFVYDGDKTACGAELISSLS